MKTIGTTCNIGSYTISQHVGTERHTSSGAIDGRSAVFGVLELQFDENQRAAPWHELFSDNFVFDLAGYPSLPKGKLLRCLSEASSVISVTVGANKRQNDRRFGSK